MHPQNTALRWVQNWRRHQRAIDAAIRDREGAASHLIWFNLAVTRPQAEITNCALKISQRHVTCILYHRHDKTLRRANRYADIVIILIDDIGAFYFCVDGWKITQRLNGGKGKHAHEAEANAMHGLEFLLILSPHRHHL